MINLKELMEEKITNFYNRNDINQDDMPNLFKEIEENFADDKDAKMKFYNQFIQNTKEIFLEEIKNSPKEKVEEIMMGNISAIIGHLENTSLSIDEIDEIFDKNGFKLETFVSKEEIIEGEASEEEEEEIITKEIDIINSRINELENNNDVKEAIEDENNKSIEKLEEELKEIDRLRNGCYAILTKKDATEEEKDEATKKIREYLKQKEELSAIVDKKRAIDNEYGNKSIEELQKELKKVERLREKVIL